MGEAAGEADQRLALADPQPLSRAPSHGLGVGTAVRVSPRITGRSQGQGAEPLCELDVLGDLGEVLVDPGVDRVEALRGAVGDERRSRFLEEVRHPHPEGFGDVSELESGDLAGAALDLAHS